MFEQRLKIVLALWLLPAAAMVARLVQLQVLRADTYRREARRMLEGRPAQYLPFLRGEITDRNGFRLAADAPAWDICVRYEVIDHDVPDEGDPEPVGPIDPCWQAIADFAHVPFEDLFARGRRIKRQVKRIHEAVSAGLGVDTRVAEEDLAHPVVKGLTQAEQVEANLHLGAYPSIEVEPSHTRAYEGGESVGHLLGRMVEVDAEAIRTDPLENDELRRYRPGDVHGVTGAEALGEPVLRGQRGRIRFRVGQEGRQTTESVEPVNGNTFRLTIDYRLQEAMYDRLAEAVNGTVFRTGGCAVLIHIPTRQILAMVDYPSVDPAATVERRAELLKDAARQPLLFRAIREYYPPGSTVKPMLMAAAMAEGLVTPETRFTCYGHIYPDKVTPPKCTGTHGTIGPVTAIEHSCNVYFCHVAERLGMNRMIAWMGRFGLGRAPGAGLPGELPGRLPEPSGLPGDARNTGIGQGAFNVTPLQVANMIATVASGRLQPPTLWLDDPQSPPGTDLPVSENVWHLVHDGMFKVVNESGGTAFLEGSGPLGDSQYVMLGKTGSAEVRRGRTIETLYVCHLPDGRVQEIVAPNRASALDKADCPPQDRDRIKVAGYRSYTRYPPDPPEPYTHAWFTGYLAPKSDPLSIVRSGDAAVAIAVVVEYTGHGGKVAAPVARDMMRMFLSRLRGEPVPPSAGGDQ